MSFTVNKFAITGTVQTGVCAGSDGNVYTCAFSDPINKITPAGSVSYFVGPSRSEDICTGLDSNLWVTNALAGGITRIVPVTETETHFAVGTDSYGVCVGPDGNIWFTCGTSATATHVQGITTAGASVANYAPTGAGNMRRICAGPDGNLWCTDTNGNIWRINPTTGASAGFDFGGSFEDICAGPDGNLWAVNVTSGHQGIWKITTAGVGASFGFSSDMYGICVGSDGALWAADYAQKAWQITTAGTVSASVALAGAAGIGICAGPDDNIWVLDYYGNVWQIVLPTPPPPTPSSPVQASMANVTYPSYFVLSPPTTVVSENQLDTGQAPVVGVDLADTGGSS